MKIEITEISQSGDGKAFIDGKPIYVPYTNIGDLVEVEVVFEKKDFIRAKIAKVIARADKYSEPPCEYYGKCGGCNMQHLNDNQYYKFKSDLLAKAIKRAGFDDVQLDNVVKIGGNSRRRAELKVTSGRGGVALGFYEKNANKLIDIQECLSVEKEISDLFPKLREVIFELKRKERMEEVKLFLSDKGIDAVFVSAASPDKAEIEYLADFAAKNKLSRLVWENDGSRYEIFDDKPYVSFSDVKVFYPEGTFMQATKQGLLEITNIITSNLKDGDKIADLFCGCGAYSFPMAYDSGGSVTAYEGDRDMVASVNKAIADSSMEGEITAYQRDLYKNPVGAKDLRKFDVVVINPPRNGAEPQVKNIVNASVLKVIMVSCNPNSLERDLKYFQKNGYKIVRAVPVDQFYWTNHLESVVILEKSVVILEK